MLWGTWKAIEEPKIHEPGKAKVERNIQEQRGFYARREHRFREEKSTPAGGKHQEADEASSLDSKIQAKGIRPRTTDKGGGESGLGGSPSKGQSVSRVQGKGRV